MEEARTANICTCLLLQIGRSHCIKNINSNVLGPKRDIAPKEMTDRLPSVEGHIYPSATYSRNVFGASLGRPKTCRFRRFFRL